MTHMIPRGDPPVAPPSLSATRFQPSLDRGRLREAIAVRRQRLAEREADLVAACEKAVAHGAGRQIRLDDRATWDRAAWNRYVGTAAQLEPEFMPASSGTSSGWNGSLRSPRHRRRPQHEQPHCRMREMERCEEACMFLTFACPHGLMCRLKRSPSTPDGARGCAGFRHGFG